MKVKKIVITLIVITIVCAVIGIVNYVYNNRYTVPDSKTTVTSSKSSNDSTTNPLLAALDVKCYQMEENGKKSVEYITLYKGVESGKLAGTAKKDALKDAVNAYVFHQSIMASQTEPSATIIPAAAGLMPATDVRKNIRNVPTKVYIALSATPPIPYESFVWNLSFIYIHLQMRNNLLIYIIKYIVTV